MSNPDQFPQSAFTRVTKAGIANRLLSPVKVISGEKGIDALALWDTGATSTCIAQSVVTALGLIPTGRQTVRTPSGEAIQNTYLVDIELPNNVQVRQIAVFGSELDSQGIGVLIGMDIITMGDFAVSNYDQHTAFTFRIPSIKQTDYVAEIKAAQVKAKIQIHGKGSTRKRHKH